MFWEVILPAMWDLKTCKCMSNSEWLTWERERDVSISSPNYDRFLFLGWTNSKIYKRTVDTPDELLARILDAATCGKKNVKINSDEQHAIFVHELQSALRFTVGFFEHLLRTVTNLSLWAGIAQLEQRLSTGWTVGDRIPLGRGRDFPHPSPALPAS